MSARLVRWLTGADVQRAVFGFLRKHHPNLNLGKRVLVTRAEDVNEVLKTDAVFSVTEIYAERMERTTGPFFLGMENTPQYQRESSISRQAVRREDLEQIRAMAREHAEQLIAVARPTGRLDVVNGLTRPVALGVVDRFFGVSGPNPETMARWMRIIFWDIFLNLGNDADVTARARTASAELKTYMEGLIAQRKAGLATEGRDDFLTRLLRMQENEATRLDDDAVRRNVGGIIVGAVDTTSKALAQLINELLERPEALGEAQSAARAGDMARVAAHAFEALRFDPHNPLLMRTCHEDYVLARGTDREMRIPKGTLVIASTLSAMFDPEVLQEPDEFRVDRPPQGYMHFGRGLHTCYGERINHLVLPEVLGCLLRLRNLRRANGGEGRMKFEGPFPNRLVVEFEPG
ncbi:cytochrome P450 [Archangium lansingense]|uniref:Cytochrome P450 n=1 Tax=Archangium lansingense TaxID=2995310 RepID=A0ABT4AMY8_9BACT|nr:cytochrome P450 [Archangium lansinium]MCY1082946.1 cytochrome P450 [Archangium lansinium]